MEELTSKVWRYDGKGKRTQRRVTKRGSTEGNAHKQQNVTKQRSGASRARGAAATASVHAAEVGLTVELVMRLAHDYERSAVVVGSA